MSNRWIRFLLAVLALAAAAGAAYRIVQDEQTLAREITTARAAAFAAETALSSIDELKSTLHAYVAPGQGHDFWTARAKFLLDKLRISLLELDTAARAYGVALGDSLDASERLAAAERRAQSFARSGQPLLAGEVIFREVRDVIDGTRINIVRVRDELAASSHARQLALRQEQTYLGAGTVAVLALVMLLLVPTGTAVAARPAVVPRVVDSAVPSVDDLDAMNAKVRAQRSPRPSAVPPPVSPSSPPTIVTAPTAEEPPPTRKSEIRKAAARDTSAADFSPVANLCVDLATVADSAQMEHMLDRARKLLNARGVIVWAGTSDRAALQPVVASGYDARVLARLGAIDRDAANITADAFRDNTVHTNPPSGSTAAAVAVPLPSPDGPAGVLSAELNPAVTIDNEALVAARLIAAQLGALLGGSVAKPQDADDVSAAGAARSLP